MQALLERVREDVKFLDQSDTEQVSVINKIKDLVTRRPKSSG